MIDAQYIKTAWEEAMPKEGEFDPSTVTPDNIPDGFVAVTGMRGNVILNVGRLEKHRESIVEMVKELPHQFFENHGGGWSTLNMCVDNQENQWGEQVSVDLLCMVGQALGIIEYQLPREMWMSLPGGMPYAVVKGVEPI